MPKELVRVTVEVSSASIKDAVKLQDTLDKSTEKKFKNNSWIVKKLIFIASSIFRNMGRFGIFICSCAFIFVLVKIKI